MSKAVEKNALANQKRPQMSTSKSTSGLIGWNKQQQQASNSHAMNMPLAQTQNMTLVLNSPQQIYQGAQQMYQPVGQGQFTHPTVTQSMSFNDSLSTINQSINNPQTLLLPFQSSGAPSSGTTTPPPQPQSSTEQFIQVNEIRKELRLKEKEFQKQTAVLKQRVQLLELQERESKQREENMRRNHEVMIRALQGGSEGFKGTGGSGGERPSYLIELEQVKAVRDDFEKEGARMARRVRELEEELRGKEYQYNSLVVQSEERDIEAERKVQELVLDKRNLDNQIKRLQNELVKAQSAEQSKEAMSSAVTEVDVIRQRLEQERSNHKDEIAKQQRFVKELKEQKACQAQQLEFLQNQLTQKDNQRTADVHQIEELEDQAKTYERQQEEMEQQIEELTMQLTSKDQVIQGMHQQIQNLIHQQSQSQHISLDLGSSIEDDYPSNSMMQKNFRNSSSPQRANLMEENQRLADENEYLNEQLKAREQSIENHKEQIKKYQGTEEVGQLEMKEQQNKINEVTAQVKVVSEELQEERERSQNAIKEQISLQQQIQQLKSEFEEQRFQQDSMLQEKQQLIERLQQEIQDNIHSFSINNDARMKDNSWGQPGTAVQQSPIRFQNVSTLMASREFQQTLFNGMQLPQQNKQSQNLANQQQTFQNISVISSNMGSKPPNTLQTSSHLNISADAQSKVFSSVAQSQKQLNEPLGASADQNSHQFQPQDNNLMISEEGNQSLEFRITKQSVNQQNVLGTTDKRHNSNNVDKQQNIPQNNNQQSAFYNQNQAQNKNQQNNATYDQNGQQDHQTTFNSRGVIEASSMEYQNYVGQFDLPRQMNSQNPVQGQSVCEVPQQNFEDTLDEQDRKWVPASELDLLQSCQKIIDAALSMKCSQCLRTFPTTDFYDHIIVRRECIVETEGNLDTSPNENGGQEPSQLLESEQFQQLYQQSSINNSCNQSRLRDGEGQIENGEAQSQIVQNQEQQSVSKSQTKDYEEYNMPLQIRGTEIEKNYATQVRTNFATVGGAMSSQKEELTVLSASQTAGIEEKQHLYNQLNEVDDIQSSQVNSVLNTAHNNNRQTAHGLLSGQKITNAAQKRLSSLSPFGQMQSSHRSGASKIGAQSTVGQGNKSKRYRHQGGGIHGASFGQTAINSFGQMNGISGTAATGQGGQGFGSRSGMGHSRGTGMTGTVHSHILMSLSRTESSRSAFSGKEIEETDPAFHKISLQNSQQNNAANFNNDQDNIKYLAANYHDQSGLLHHMHMQNYVDQNLVTESGQTANDHAAILAITDTNLSQTNNSPNPPLPHQETDMSHAQGLQPNLNSQQEQSVRISQGDSTKRQDVNQGAELLNTDRHSQVDDDMQNNMLSQSLREIVNNHEMPGTRTGTGQGAAGQDTTMQSMINRDSTSPNMKAHLPHPIHEDIVTSLQKLYDLDTSRFDEEYSNMPSDKKMLLFKQLVEDEVNFGDEPQETEQYPVEEEGNQCLLDQTAEAQLSQQVVYSTIEKTNDSHIQHQSKFADISRFNNSLPNIQNESQQVEQPSHLDSYDNQEQQYQQQNNQVRVVGLNLAPIIAKQSQQAVNQKQQLGNQGNLKPKFDLSTKFQEMNKKRDVCQRVQQNQQAQQQVSNKGDQIQKKRAASQKNLLLGSGRQNSQRKQMPKKNLNIEVDSTDEQKSRKVCTSVSNINQGAVQGQLNLDLTKVTGLSTTGHQQAQPNHQQLLLSGQQQPTSRRHAAPLGSNRYSKRGILIPDSSSYTSSPESQPMPPDQSARQPPQELIAGGSIKPISSSKKDPLTDSKKNAPVQPSHLLNNESVQSPKASRNAAEKRGVIKAGDEDGPEDKTVEQPGTRQLNNTVKFLSTLNGDKLKNTQQVVNGNRLDSSGFDINFGSEIQSPLSKKMQKNQTQSISNQNGVIKLKPVHQKQQNINRDNEQQIQQHNMLFSTLEDGNQIRELSKEGYQQHQRSNNQLQLDNDLADEITRSQFVNTQEGFNQGDLQSHRHQLGRHGGFVPTLLKNQEQKLYDQTMQMNVSQRGPGATTGAGLTESDQQQVRKFHVGQYSQQSTFDRRQQVNLKQVPPLGSTTIDLYNKTSNKQIVSTLYFKNNQNGKQASLFQKQSPTKNSDYIRRSILLSHRSAGTAGNKTKRGEDVDCPSVYDDNEFAEDCVQVENEEHLPATSNDTRGKIPLQGSHGSQTKQPKTLTRRDPLKNSLFHNFKVQTQRLYQQQKQGGLQSGIGGGIHQLGNKHATIEVGQHSYANDNDDSGGIPSETLRGTQSFKDLAYTTQFKVDPNYSHNVSMQQHLYLNNNIRNQTTIYQGIPSPKEQDSQNNTSNSWQLVGPGTSVPNRNQTTMVGSGLHKHKSLSQLQQHKSQTSQLQRSRENSKRKGTAMGLTMHQQNFATAKQGMKQQMAYPVNTSAMTSMSQYQANHVPCISPLSISNLSFKQQMQPHHHQGTTFDHLMPQSSQPTMPHPTASHRHYTKPLLYFNESNPSSPDTNPNAKGPMPAPPSFHTIQPSEQLELHYQHNYGPSMQSQQYQTQGVSPHYAYVSQSDRPHLVQPVQSNYQTSMALGPKRGSQQPYDHQMSTQNRHVSTSIFASHGQKRPQGVGKVSKHNFQPL